METVEFGGVSCMWCIDLGMDASDVLFNGPVRCIVGCKKRSNSRYYWQASSRVLLDKRQSLAGSDDMNRWHH